MNFSPLPLNDRLLGGRRHQSSRPVELRIPIFGIKKAPRSGAWLIDGQMCCDLR